MDIQQYSSRRDAETDTGTDWFVGLGGFTVSPLYEQTDRNYYRSSHT